jgi:hypothetical protein
LIDTIPSNTSIKTPKTTLTRGHFPLGEIGLGELTLSKSYRVASIDSFILDKSKGKIVK